MVFIAKQSWVVQCSLLCWPNNYSQYWTHKCANTGLNVALYIFNVQIKTGFNFINLEFWSPYEINFAVPLYVRNVCSKYSVIDNQSVNLTWNCQLRIEMFLTACSSALHSWLTRLEIFNILKMRCGCLCCGHILSQSVHDTFCHVMRSSALTKYIARPEKQHHHLKAQNALQ